MWKKIQEIVEARGSRRQGEDLRLPARPILFAYFNEALGTMGYFLGGTGLMMIALLWFYFRTIQGVVIPIFSGLMSAVWGLGFAGLCGFTLDPLVIVVFVLITARTLSHSVQSMERYHEEYFRLDDKHAAIIRSYVSLYAPGDGVDHRRRPGDPDHRRRHHPADAEARLRRRLLDHLDLPQRRHAASDHPHLRPAAEGAPQGQPLRQGRQLRSGGAW